MQLQANSAPPKRKRTRSSAPVKSVSVSKKFKPAAAPSVSKKIKSAAAHGHGFDLEEKTLGYFRDAFKQSKQKFENDGEKRKFVETVFARAVGHEVDYSKNQLASRVVEHLLPLTTNETLERFTTAFGKHLKAACVDCYASHVVEKMVCVCTERVHDLARESPSAYQSSASFAFVMKVSKFLANNLDEFVSDNYANHVIRATISCLANILPPEKQRVKVRRNKRTKKFAVKPAETGSNLEKLNKNSTFNPPEFVAVLEDIANRILKSSKFVDYPSDTAKSALLQVILISLHAVEKKSTVQSICTKLLETTYVSSQRSEVLASQSHLFLLQTVLDVSDKKLFAKIYEQYFAGQLAKLAKERPSCFTVAKLVKRCDDKDKFLEMYAEITEGETLREIAHSTGHIILATVASACRRLSVKQVVFVKDISMALDVDSSALVPALLNFKPAKSVITPDQEKKKTYSFPGCVILQELLRFEKRSKIVKGLFTMENDELVKMFCDPKGSYIAESFFSVDVCTDEELETMMNKLQGSFAKLAASRHGLFAVSALWARCPPVALKTKVVEEIATAPLKKFGKVVAKIELESYIDNPKQWIQSQKKAA